MSADMYEGQIPTIQYNILLTEKILTNQRKYIQFIDILGDVGGLMEVLMISIKNYKQYLKKWLPRIASSQLDNLDPTCP